MQIISKIFEVLKTLNKNQEKAVALLAPGRKSLNYSDLNIQIHYCASVLSTLDIERTSRIAVVLPNGPEMATCCLGVMAYATCAPLNPAYQENEFRFYLEDLNASVLIIPQGSNSPAIRVAENLGVQVLELSFEEHSSAGQFKFIGFENINTVTVQLPSPDRTAMVLHTSGTTSRPKIVPLSHNNLYVSAGHVARSLSLNANDRCLNVMPLFHIHGIVTGLLSSLVVKGSIICTSGFKENEFPGWLTEFKPSWYSAVPTIHQSILKLAERYKNSEPLHQLRFIRSSSSALPPATLKALKKLFNVPVIEGYGMTEEYLIACNPLPPLAQKPGSVGLPAGPEVSIMDEHGKLLNQGKTGEIVIRGENVIHGYENNEQANKSAFTSGWFRTGDQGWFDEDGYLFITGRLKEIINRGGEKISPREIDEVLIEHPSVSQAVAFSIPHSSLGEDIIAAVVLKKDESITPQSLRFYLFEKVSDYKVPSKIIIVDEIPKGATGKIQRLKLAELLSENLIEKYIAPTTDIEQQLADFIKDILGIERIGCNDNFFAIGGDSIRAMQLVSRVNARYELELSMPILFRHPSVSELANEIENALSQQEKDMVTMISEIENLSDEEVKQLLNKQ